MPNLQKKKKDVDAENKNHLSKFIIIITICDDNHNGNESS